MVTGDRCHACNWLNNDLCRIVVEYECDDEREVSPDSISAGSGGTVSEKSMNSVHSHGSVQVAPHGASIVQIESSRLIPWMFIASGVAFLALGVSIVTLINSGVAYRELERENRLLQLKVDEFRMALITAGIEPNPHAEGESK